jgi:hypothetical protein
MIAGLVLLTAWLAAGAMIGVDAASRRGFSAAIGLLVGMVVGPVLALMLYLIPKPRRRCPHCTARIPAAAFVCQHCGRDVYGVTVR